MGPDTDLFHPQLQTGPMSIPLLGLPPPVCCKIDDFVIPEQICDT